MKKIRILMVDDHVMFREGLGRILSAEPDFEVAGLCASTDEALSAVSSTAVDIVLLDFDLGAERGSAFLQRAGQYGYQGKVLMVTAGLNDMAAAHLMARGASGIVLKHSPAGSLAESIRSVMEGGTCVDPAYREAVLSGSTSAPPSYRKPKLSAQEKAVLDGVVEGLTNKEIAQRLHLTESSVKATLQHVFNKTGVRTRSRLVRAALENF